MRSWRLFLFASALGAAPLQDPIEVRSVTPPGPAADLKVEWKAPFLPDGTTLSVQLRRLEERFKDGALKADTVSSGGGQGYAKGGAFGWSGPVGGPGSYVATIELTADLQGARALQALKDGKVALPQKWTSPFDAWGDELAAQLPPALEEFDALAGKVDALVQKCILASVDRPTWREKAPGLEAEARDLMEKAGQTGARRVFTAASSRLSAALGILLATPRCLRFGRDGKPAGFFNMENPQEPVVKFEGEIFGWETHRKRIENMKETAGREFALWAFRDLRRTAGRPAAALQAALQSCARHPGLAPHAEKLLRGNPPKEMEDAIRGLKK